MRPLRDVLAERPATLEEGVEELAERRHLLGWCDRLGYGCFDDAGGSWRYVGGAIVDATVGEVGAETRGVSRGVGRSVRRRGRRVALLASVALVLVACGDGEDVGEVDAQEAGPELAPGSEEPAEAAEDTEPASPEDAEEDEPADDEDAGEGGVREHRPPEEPEAFADCGAIDDDAPGAVIRFPSEEVAGSLDAGDGPVTVEVVGCGNTFEANVQWEAYHGEDRNPTLEGHTMGGTMGDWGAFSIAETYWTPGDWTVVVFEIDAASGDRVEYDEVTFAVG